jgi:hypothetical protein
MLPNLECLSYKREERAVPSVVAELAREILDAAGARMSGCNPGRDGGGAGPGLEISLDGPWGDMRFLVGEVAVRLGDDGIERPLSFPSP